jgi:hypothetical protein
VPLNEEERRILEEIESHLYEEEVAESREPKLLYSSKVATVVPVGLLALGMLVVLIFFTSRLLIALAGFVVMVVAATFLVQGLRARKKLSWKGVRGSRDTRANGFGSWPR